MPRLPSLESLEQHPGRVFAAIGLVFAAAYVTALTAFPRAHGRVLDGDAIQYYAYLRSIVIDGDVDFTNDYRLLYTPTGDAAADNVWLTSKTAIGRPPNLMSIGPALLWSPPFLVTYGFVSLARALGGTTPLDGVALPFLLSVGLAGIGYATLGAYLCYLSGRLIAPDAAAFWGALAAWLATPAVYYSVISPAYSHATSLFAGALFVYFWLKTRGAEGLGRYAGLGIIGGLVTLVRWQEIVILLLPLLELMQLTEKPRMTVVTAASRAALMALGVGVVLVPQLWAWRAIFGQLLVVPQGGGFMRWGSPALGSVLFSLRHGLFTWTPAVLVAVLGFPALVRRDRVLGWGAIGVLLLTIYINASVNDWWGGEAFGARRFVGLTIFFALGFAAMFAGAFWQRRPGWMRWTAVALIAYNLLFLVQYQLFMRGFRELAPYPDTIRQVFFDRLTLPWHLLRVWMGG